MLSSKALFFSLFFILAIITIDQVESVGNKTPVRSKSDRYRSTLLARERAINRVTDKKVCTMRKCYHDQIQQLQKHLNKVPHGLSNRDYHLHKLEIESSKKQIADSQNKLSLQLFYKEKQVSRLGSQKDVTSKIYKVAMALHDEAIRNTRVSEATAKEVEEAKAKGQLDEKLKKSHKLQDKEKKRRIDEWHDQQYFMINQPLRDFYKKHRGEIRKFKQPKKQGT